MNVKELEKSRDSFVETEETSVVRRNVRIAAVSMQSLTFLNEYRLSLQISNRRLLRPVFPNLFPPSLKSCDTWFILFKNWIFGYKLGPNKRPNMAASWHLWKKKIKERRDSWSISKKSLRNCKKKIIIIIKRSYMTANKVLKHIKENWNAQI